MTETTVERLDIQASFTGGDAQAGLDKLYTTLDKISRITDKVTKVTENSARATITSKVNFASLERVATVTAKALSKCFTATNDYVESLNLFNVAMGDATQKALEYAMTVERVMGINSGDWMNYQGSYNQIFEGYGLDPDQANQMSQQLTQLTYDLSSLWNVDTDTAFQKIQSGMSGQIKGLKVWGYNLSVASLRETALAHGIELSTAKMTEAQKAILRYVTLMDASSNAHGDLARTILTPANSLRILKSQFEIMQRTVGQVVSVFAVKLIPVVQVMIQWVTALAEKMAQAFGYELPEIDYTGISAGAGYADDLANGLDESANKAEKLKRSLLGIDEINKLSDNSSSSTATEYGGGYAPDFGMNLDGYDYDFLANVDTSGVDKLKEKLEGILPIVGAIASGIATWKVTSGFITAVKVLKELLAIPKYKIAIGATIAVAGFSLEASGIKDAIENGLAGMNFGEIVLGGLIGTGGTAVLVSGIAKWITTSFAKSKIASAITSAAANLGSGTVGALGATIGAGIGGIIAGIPMYITGIYDAVKNGLDWLNGVLIPLGSTMAGAGIGAIIGSLGGPIGAGIGALIGLAVGLLTDFGILIAEKWESISTWFTETFAPVGEFFSELWTDISATASDCWDSIVEFFSPAIEWFSELFGSVGQTLSDVFYNIGVIASGCWEIIKTAWGLVSTWFSENVTQPVSQFFTDLWSGFVEKARTAWEGVKSVFSTVTNFFGNIFGKAWKKVVEVFSPVGEVFKEIKDAVLAGFKTVVNGLINGINKVVAIPFNGINNALMWLKGVSILGVQPFTNLRVISIPQIPTFADGGFPQAGEMFIANEAGPELVGTIGNKTAVANQGQIEAGIAMGVADANEEQNKLLREQNALLTKLLNKEAVVQAYVTTSDIVDGLSRKNRRDGKTTVPVGV